MRTAPAGPAFGPVAWRLSAGVVVWAVHFGLRYGISSLACAADRPNLALWGIAVSTAVALAALSAIVLQGWWQHTHFERWLQAALGLFALSGVLLNALPVLVLEVCA
ncbi:MAG: hypothetical protein ABIQ29_05610 [Burkholderiaceae bacterium]